jgi:putative membrane protein
MPINKNTPQPNLTNELARERSRQATDRTLMAWVRTALALIGFGFGIAQFRDLVGQAGGAGRPLEQVNSAFIFGLSFIILGIAGLSAATYQHWRILQQIKQNRFDYTGFRPLALIAAILLIIIGLFGIVVIVLRIS